MALTSRFLHWANLASDTSAALGTFVVLVLVACSNVLLDTPTTGSRGSTNRVIHITPAMGPLAVHPFNPRYFTDGNGRAIYLTGSHTWGSLQDIKTPGISSKPFDYAAYLDYLQRFNHNFIRLWSRESTLKYSDEATTGPLPYLRTGPGEALDGQPKFDVSRFNQEYFDRLRARVVAAREREIYIMVMLFQGFSIDDKGRHQPSPWRGHYFNGSNNVNGINGDVNGDGHGEEVHTLQIPTITRLQEAYVRKVVDTLNDLDNVLYEIANESHTRSVDWQYHMIRYIYNYEREKTLQHSVVMTFLWDGQADSGNGDNTALFASPAAAIAPGRGLLLEYRDDPPAADGSKVILSDTDHLWGVGGNPAWVWKSFLRGLNPIFMDPYDKSVDMEPPFDPQWDPVRRTMGYTLTYARRMNLAAMVPRGDLASTGYCLANPGREYLVYLPTDLHELELGVEPARSTVTVDLAAAFGEVFVEWFNPTTGETVAAETARGRTTHAFTAPFRGNAILYLATDKAANQP